jgi:hypothetical protein
MASRATNEAVELYRKLAKFDRKRAEMERELTDKVAALDDVSFRAYMSMTSDIDRAIDTAEDVGANKQTFTQLIQRAGVDR